MTRGIYPHKPMSEETKLKNGSFVKSPIKLESHKSTPETVDKDNPAF